MLAARCTCVVHPKFVAGERGGRILPDVRAPEFVFLTDEGEAARFGWRLNAGNRRPLGRGVLVTGSLAACRADAENVRRAADYATVSVTASEGRWSWRLSVDGTPIATSVRPYLRRVECVRGLALFRAALRHADPHAGAVRAFGPSALRGYGIS